MFSLNVSWSRKAPLLASWSTRSLPESACINGKERIVPCELSLLMFLTPSDIRRLVENQENAYSANSELFPCDAHLAVQIPAAGLLIISLLAGCAPRSKPLPVSLCCTHSSALST